MRSCVLFVLATPLLYTDNTEQLRFFDERLTALEDQVNRVKIYNSSGRAEVADGINLFLVGEFLYLQPQENGMAYAIKTNDPIHTTDNDKLSYKNLDFGYRTGYRGGIGFNIPHDQWDLYLSWMHYNTHAKNTSSAHNGTGLIPLWSGVTFDSLPTIAYATHAQARLRLNINIFDLELGREYYVGKWVTLRPSLGVRTAFIHQHYHILYNPFIVDALSFSDQIKLKNECWGVGPKVSINSQWNLWLGFHFYGSAALSLLYSHFEIRRHENFTDLDKAPLSSRQNLELVRAVADLAAGIGWDIMLVGNQYHVALRAGYEQHLYFGQNQLDQITYTPFHANVISNLGDLSLAGWTLSLRVDF